jgi:prophage regulatory protein
MGDNSEDLSMPDISPTLERRRQVEQRTGLKRTRLDDLEKQGLFPKRVVLSARAIAWVKSEVDDWIRARIAARDKQSQPHSDAA